MRVSHETIYQSLYVQGRGALKRELSACLRAGRALREPRARTHRSSRSFVTDEVKISQRPAEAQDPAVRGHWEGDRIIGSDTSAVGTLVERTSRLPEQLRRSLTWDQGGELAQHGQLRIDAGIGVWFCDPHSPWQRPSNENTNGLLRQYFPKGTDLSRWDAAEVQAIAVTLNGRPVKTLGWRTPAEVFAEQQSSTTQAGVASTP